VAAVRHRRKEKPTVGTIGKQAPLMPSFGVPPEFLDFRSKLLEQQIRNILSLAIIDFDVLCCGCHPRAFP